MPSASIAPTLLASPPSALLTPSLFPAKLRSVKLQFSLSACLGCVLQTGSQRFANGQSNGYVQKVAVPVAVQQSLLRNVRYVGEFT
jgi:hypothetical protein